MGGAMLRSMSQAFPQHQFLLVEPDDTKRLQLQQQTGCDAYDTFGEPLRAADLVWLAVKPQLAPSLFPTLALNLRPEQVLISIMAGLSLETLHQGLAHDRTIRVMPNTPSLIGEGMSAFYANDAVSASEREVVKQLLSVCGKSLEVPSEDAIDAATAISGSGPAYVFYLAEHMSTAAQQLGFTSDEARTLVQQTLRGAALLWESQTVDAVTLRRQVTSPGGTTEAAVHSFEASHVGAHLQAGLLQAYRRARELGRPSQSSNSTKTE